MLCSIGELAQLLGVAVVTLRRWHAAGSLLPTCRTAGGHRRYNLAQARDQFGLGAQSELIFSICKFFNVSVEVLDADAQCSREQQLTEDWWKS